MLIPSLPSNEAERLHTLHELKILDTPLQSEFERITRIALQIYKVPMAAISLVDQHRLWFKSTQGLDISECSRESSFCAHAILQDNIFTVPDTSLDNRFLDNSFVLETPHIRFYAGYPLRALNGEMLGMMCIFDEVSREIAESELLYLQDLAALVESEIYKYKIVDSYQSIVSQLKQAHLSSMVDPLTQLWNRKGLDSLLKSQLNECKKQGSLLGIALVDIDNFKKINDTYGHLIGDRALKNLGKCLVNSCRKYDVIGRWGGEEFLILIMADTQKDIEGVLERLRLKVEKLPIFYENKMSFNLTVTIGATICLPNQRFSYETLVDKADKALYIGKNTGKNCVRLSI